MEIKFSATSVQKRIKKRSSVHPASNKVNNLMVLNIHKDQCEELDLVDVANTFVAGSEHRLSLFGKFMLE